MRCKNFIKKFFCLIFTSQLCFVFKGVANFEFTANCKQAYSNIIALDYLKAIQILQLEKKTNPSNSLRYYLENHIDFLQLVLSQDYSKYDAAYKRFSNRITLIKKDESKGSPYFYYILSEMYFQQSIIELQFGNYFSGSYMLFQSYRYIKQNENKHPTFFLNDKIAGIFEILLGGISQDHSFITSTIGVRGDISKGLFRLENFYKNNKNKLLAIESQIILAFAYQNFSNNDKKAYTFLASIDSLSINNPLLLFTYANAMIHAGKTDLAIDLLEKNIKSFNNTYFIYPLYLLGTAKLYRIDNDANIFLEEFIKHYKGKHYLKTAYHKLSWYYWIYNNKEKYNECIMNIKIYGSNTTDADKQAIIETASPNTLNTILLKSRLLFDGGYYKQALTLLLTNADETNYSATRDNIEYFYRLARIYHKMEQIPMAIKYYQIVIDRSTFLPYYYAPFSALQIGNIYELQGDTLKAISYYKQCINSNRNEYSTGIYFKAKAGLNRLR